MDGHMGVSENSGTPKSSILIGFSIRNHPFWGTTIFGNTHMVFVVYLLGVRTTHDFFVVFKGVKDEAFWELHNWRAWPIYEYQSAKYTV